MSTRLAEELIEQTGSYVRVIADCEAPKREPMLTRRHDNEYSYKRSWSVRPDNSRVKKIGKNKRRKG